MEENFDLRFFCPLIPEYSSKKLVVPEEIAKNIKINENRRTASIVTPNANVHHVDIFTESEKMYIGGTGWKNFLEEHNLIRNYDLMIFCYRGNMIFTLSVFDKKTCCEKKFPNDYSRKEAQEKVDDDDDETQNKERIDKNITHVAVSNDQVQAHFEATLTANSLKSHHMYVPVTFKEASGIENHSEAILVDPKGRRWQVGLNHTCTRNNIKTYFSKNWGNFVSSNDLQAGDNCIFQVLSEENSKKVIKVQFLKKKRPCKPVKAVNEEVIILEDDGNSNSIKKPTKSSSKKRKRKDYSSQENSVNEHNVIKTPPHFDVIVSTRHLKRCRLHLPRAFKDATGLGKLSEVVLIDPSGQRWSVALAHYHNQRHSDTYIMSWRQFFVSNKLQEGDKCVFEEKRGENNDKEIQVHILKKMKKTKNR